MFARTKRLTLRPGWPEDAPALHRAVAHEEVVRMLAQVPWPYELGHAEAFLARPRGICDVTLLILSREPDCPGLVGAVGIHPTSEGERELGYWLTPGAWGRGYATEAAGAMVAIARHTLGLKRLVSGHFVDNPASGRVLRKLGFRPVGVAQRFCAGRGEEVPCQLLELDLAGDEEEIPADTAMAA
jgi:RimJ/RimL family protein N-acetyltransferase